MEHSKVCRPYRVPKAQTKGTIVPASTRMLPCEAGSIAANKTLNSMQEQNENEKDFWHFGMFGIVGMR